MATAIMIARETRARQSTTRRMRPLGPRGMSLGAPLGDAARLHRRIEYIASDWSQVQSESRPVTEGAAARRLSAEEEVSLFRHMNYVKHRAERLRQAVQDTDSWAEQAPAIERLLEESTRLRNYLVQVFSKLAVAVARQYANAEFRLDELLSEAHLTLLRCVEIFDADRGYRFSTYATNAIRHNLNRYVSQQHKLRQLTREYLAADGVAADPIENPRHREREYSLRMSGLCRWIGELEPREQTILRLRYGLTNRPCRVTLQSLAEQLGLSRERIRQLEIRAIEKLRARARRAAFDLES
jgi:RNA polymerase primary sigma factor